MPSKVDNPAEPDYDGCNDATSEAGAVSCSRFSRKDTAMDRSTTSRTLPSIVAVALVGLGVVSGFERPARAEGPRGPSSSRPNVILAMADDMGWGDPDAEPRRHGPGRAAV